MTEPAHRKPLGLEDKIVREGRVIQARVLNEARKPAQPEQHNLLQMAIARVKAKQQLANLRAEPILNRDTHRRWLPHHAEEENFVFNDLPRYVYLKGGEGCFSGESLVEGVPIAELPQGQVQTVAGQANASQGYRKGKADLYRVQTQSGAEVVVTLAHRFLTPIGWRPLSDLAVGTSIAADGNWHADSVSETKSNCQDDCLKYSHRHDAQLSPLQVFFQDKVRQLCDCDTDYPYTSFHACTGNSFSLLAPTLPQVESLFHAESDAYESSRMAHDNPVQSPRRSHLPYIASQFHPSAKEFLDTLWEDVFHVWLESALLTHGTPLTLLQFLLNYSHDGMNQVPADALLSCSESLSLYSTLPSLNDSTPLIAKLPVSELSLLDFGSADIHVRPLASESVSCYNDNTYWTKIKSIAFERFGEFYDLHVPFWNHYSAQGLYHHNSGKSAAGTVKTIWKLRRGMNGISGSPDFEHYKKSLWAEFRRWVNPDWLVEKDRYRLSPVWEPAKQFELHFNTIYGNIATLYCGGFDDPTGWEGPNVNFAHFDEPRRHKEPDMLKVLDGRVRIPGPQMEPPQIYLTGTPAKHWLWEYFGNIECKCLNCETEFSDTGALDKDTFRKGICPVCGM